jgi:hypothetical protein
MQIALVAVVLLAGMWFTVLKPKPAADTAAVTPVTVTPAPASSEPVAPGVKGLASAVEKAKSASAASDATNAKIQKATGSSSVASAPTAAKPAVAPKPAAAKATPPASKAVKHTTPAKAKSTAAVKTAAKAKSTAAVKTAAKAAAPVAATAKPAVAKAPATATKKAVPVDPSARLLKFLDRGKTLVILFHGAGADDRGARKAVHRTAKADPKHIISAYIPIGDVGKYEAITSDVQILASPSILVIGTNGKATLLTGYVDAAVVRQTVGDARRASAADAKTKTAK